MTNATETYGDQLVLLVEADGPAVASQADGRDLLERAMSERADWVAVPTARLGDAFFDLSTGVAGSVVQQLQNYGCGLAVVGDVGHHAEASSSFRALVAEAQRSGGRRGLLFAADGEDLRRRLEARAA